MLNPNYFYEFAYQYYPKGISGIRNGKEYINSAEYQQLVKITSAQNGLYRISDLELIKKEIESEFNTKLLNHTVDSLNDRCYNWQFKLSTESATEKKDIMCINISKIIPFYLIYILEVEFCEKLGRLKYNPRRNLNLENETYKMDIKKIEHTIKTQIAVLKPFPKDNLESIIPNIGFEYIELGQFNMFNAFFLNKFTTRFA